MSFRATTIVYLIAFYLCYTFCIKKDEKKGSHRHSQITVRKMKRFALGFELTEARAEHFAWDYRDYDYITMNINEHGKGMDHFIRAASRETMFGVRCIVIQARDMELLSFGSYEEVEYDDEEHESMNSTEEYGDDETILFNTVHPEKWRDCANFLARTSDVFRQLFQEGSTIQWLENVSLPCDIVCNCFREALIATISHQRTKTLMLDLSNEVMRDGFDYLKEQLVDVRCQINKLIIHECYGTKLDRLMNSLNRDDALCAKSWTTLQLRNVNNCQETELFFPNRALRGTMCHPNSIGRNINTLEFVGKIDFDREGLWQLIILWLGMMTEEKQIVIHYRGGGHFQMKDGDFKKLKPFTLALPNARELATINRPSTFFIERETLWKKCWKQLKEIRLTNHDEYMVHLEHTINCGYPHLLMDHVETCVFTEANKTQMKNDFMSCLLIGQNKRKPF